MARSDFNIPRLSLPAALLISLALVLVTAWVLYFRDVPADHAGMTPAMLDQLPNQGRQLAVQRPKVPWGPLTRRMMPSNDATPMMSNGMSNRRATSGADG